MARKASAASVLGSRINSHGIELASATDVLISTRVSSSFCCSVAHRSRASSLEWKTFRKSFVPMFLRSPSMRAATVGAGSCGHTLRIHQRVVERTPENEWFFDVVDGVR